MDPIDAYLAFETVEKLLQRISTDNGFNTNPTVREGWLLQIVSPERSRKEITFPLLALRPELSTPTYPPSDNVRARAKNETRMVIDGAIQSNVEKPVEQLLALMHDVRKALAVDLTNRLEKQALDLGNRHLDIEVLQCPYDIPEKGDQYAFFSQTITYTMEEKYA